MTRIVPAVIIPCRNAGVFLDEQLQSLVGQRARFEFDVIIADNRSTDESRSIARRYERTFDWVRVVDAGAARTPGSVRNIGAASCGHDRLVFLDADDVAGDGYVEVLSAALDRSPLVASRIDVELLNAPWVCEARRVPQTSGLGEGDVPFAYAGTMALTRELFTNLGGFAEGMRTAEDIDLCRRAHAAGVKLSWIDSAVLHYRLRSTVQGLVGQAFAYGRGGALACPPKPTALVRPLLGGIKELATGPTKGRRVHGACTVANRIGALSALVVDRRSGVGLAPVERGS